MLPPPSTPEEARRLRRAFEEKEPAELRRRVLDLLRRWRAELPQEIWFEEICNLAPASQALLAEASDLEEARRFLEQVSREITGSGGVMPSAGVIAWFRRVERRLPDSAWNDARLQPALHRLWWIAHRADETPAPPPPRFDPAHVSAGDLPLRRLHIRQRGGDIVIVAPAAVGELVSSGSLFAHIDSRNRLIEVAPIGFWKEGAPPAWAAAWGTDDFGPWVSFSVEGQDGTRVTQRLRWIPAGRFLMGSPVAEAERYQDERRHEVRISRGFWLFDTACTQALWETVMGDNPSYFRGAERPVETVSWEDCVRFLERINAQLFGLNLRLPTEAEWEYACRAGTTTPFSFGETITRKQVNYDSNETVPVASLPANPCGLYEMHGNVWEWCADGMRTYTAEAVTDPVGPTDPGAERVLRGGSWYSVARLVRSAYRSAIVPGSRDNSVGFRCARVQDGAEPSGAEPVGTGPIRQAERRTAPVRPGGAAALLRLDGDRPEAGYELPRAPAILVRSDCERLTFGRITRPPWASAIGRDCFGLWVDIEVPPVATKPGGKKRRRQLWKSEKTASAIAKPVSQRLRWIPPGWFLMGSPEAEGGRWDSERPRHEVRLAHGFWLFDTPCTQGLWQAVMDHNPSYFQSSDRPVEQVSWDDVQGFLSRINERVPGLDLVLPSEAQWEYACRAGTKTATYAGGLQILGANNAPALDPIAWYGGNSGVGFELDNGWDSSGWPEKQYPHQRAGTRPVALREPNAWGLYDMLGNVWEWCADGARDYQAEAVTDPVGPTVPGAGRVRRGGSWSNDARYVRSACRLANAPGGRGYSIGFRCARVQS